MAAFILLLTLNMTVTQVVETQVTKQQSFRSPLSLDKHKLIFVNNGNKCQTCIGCSGGQLIACRPPTNATWVQFLAGDLILEP